MCNATHHNPFCLLLTDVDKFLECIFFTHGDIKCFIIPISLLYIVFDVKFLVPGKFLIK